MNTLKRSITSIVLCLFELIVGILLLVEPEKFSAGIIIASGAVLLVTGLISIIKYFRTDITDVFIAQNLTKGLLAITLGGFCILKTDWFLTTFPVLTVLYGCVIFVTGFGKIQRTVDMIRLRNKKWYWSAVSAIVSILCAVIIWQDPFNLAESLWAFIGIALVIGAVLDVITITFRGRLPIAESTAIDCTEDGFIPEDHLINNA